VHRTRGHTHGPITRLVSPSDLGELIKPFVFLDLAVFDGREAPFPMETGWHPHSGIATVTVMLEGAVQYAETTGKAGVLPAGGVEWMRAGLGAWHTGAPEPGAAKAFQLWLRCRPSSKTLPTPATTSCRTRFRSRVPRA
jgi:redox-sensitive bicupin YhaK (pirin superfamily)